MLFTGKNRRQQESERRTLYLRRIAEVLSADEEPIWPAPHHMREARSADKPIGAVMEEICSEQHKLEAESTTSFASVMDRLDRQEKLLTDLRVEMERRGSLVERLFQVLHGSDARRELRQPSRKSVKILVGTEQKAAVPGLIVNQAQSGLGLLMDEPAPPGSKLQIGLDGTVVVGEVVQCIPYNHAYKVGVRLKRAHRL